MMSATLHLQAFYQRFDDMITGRAPMTTYEAAEFKREPRSVMARVGLMELGITNETIDVMLIARQPGSNVVEFNRAKLRLLTGGRDGAAS